MTEVTGMRPSCTIKAITFQGHAMYPVLSNTGSALELATVYTYEMTLGLRQ